MATLQPTGVTPDDVILMLVRCFPISRTGVPIENCFAGGDTLRISASTLHRQILESFGLRFVEKRHDRRPVFVEIITLCNGQTDRRADYIDYIDAQ